MYSLLIRGKLKKSRFLEIKPKVEKISQIPSVGLIADSRTADVTNRTSNSSGSRFLKVFFLSYLCKRSI